MWWDAAATATAAAAAAAAAAVVGDSSMDFWLGYDARAEPGIGLSAFSVERLVPARRASAGERRRKWARTR